jgi:hypothetical protein
MLEWFFF